jgi:hypothetical protein
MPEWKEGGDEPDTSDRSEIILSLLREGIDSVRYDAGSTIDVEVDADADVCIALGSPLSVWVGERVGEVSDPEDEMDMIVEDLRWRKEGCGCG